MGTVVRFPLRRHARASTSFPLLASSRAANEASKEALTPAIRAVRVAKIEAHHSEGIRSRCDHFGIAVTGAPISEANAPCVGQRAMMLRKDEGRRDMASSLGHYVLKSKAELSDDPIAVKADDPGMAERMTETEERLAFIRRTRLARESRFDTQKPICTILGIEQGTYKQYETRTPLPHRFIPKFVAATGVSFEWLLGGEGQGPKQEGFIKYTPPKRSSAQKKTKAA